MNTPTLTKSDPAAAAFSPESHGGARRRLAMAGVLLFVALSHPSVLRAEAREWTNLAGKKIVGELVGQSGDSIKVLVGGREFSIPVANLSQEDKDYLAGLAEAEAKEAGMRAEKASALVGERKRIPMTRRLFPAWEDYYQDRFGKALLRAANNPATGVSKESGKPLIALDARQAVEWPPGSTTEADGGMMDVYCPASYDGTKPFALMVWISPSDWAAKPKDGWKEILDSHQIIFASPYGTSNEQCQMRRIVLLLDAVATLRDEYHIDPERILCGGTSGGGAIAAIGAMNYGLFRGVVCAARSIRPEPVPEMAWFDRGEARVIAKSGQRFAWVCGGKDYNHEYVRGTPSLWEALRIESRHFDDPDLGHDAPPAPLLNEALEWVFAAEFKAPEAADK